MINFERIGRGAREIVKRVGTKTWIAACAVVLLGSAVVINFVLAGGGEDEKKLAVDLSADPGVSPSALASSEEDSGSISDYFAAVSLQRKQARDEAMEVLLSVSENETAIEEARQAAVNDMNTMAAQIECEANIETLVQAKGFAQCVAVISDGSCSVIVESDGLMPGEIAQISEIVYEQAGIVPENLKIIEKNS